MLFYLLQYWKVENIENQKIALKEAKQGIFEITGPDIILERLSMLIDPKNEVIKMIKDELWFHQAMNGIPEEKRIPIEAVDKLLNEVLEMAKNKFPLMRELNKHEVRYVY